MVMPATLVRTVMAVLAVAAAGGFPAIQSAPGYLVAVASEAADKLTFVRFAGGTARIESDIDTGIMPADVDGPHGLAASPDGRFFYVSLAHGQPNGTVLKYASDTRTVLGRVTLGMFPATLQTSPDGAFLYVVNFNLHGDPVPSSVSIVLTDRMAEVARVSTCRMPHGSRVSPDGARHYSACMMDDALVEIDTARLAVARHFIVTRGRETGGSGAPAAAGGKAVPSTHAGHGTEAPPAGSTACSPTWAQPTTDGSSVFVACNGTSELVEVDAASWTLRRRLAARPGVYNLAVTRNGRLIATNKRDQSVSVIEIASGKEMARLPTRRRVVHGVVVSPDDRYAFVTVEGVAAEPGTLEIIDLATLTTVAVVDVAPQAGGIDLLK
jgi:DNA-binding beta-propeller fold protein YncE